MRVHVRDTKGNRERLVLLLLLLPQQTLPVLRGYWRVHQHPRLLFPNRAGGLRGSAAAQPPADPGGNEALPHGVRRAHADAVHRLRRAAQCPTRADTAPARTASTTKPRSGSSARRSCWYRPPTSMLTFTLPAQLRGLAWGHQRVAYALLTQCAWDTLHTFSRNDAKLGATPGAVGCCTPTAAGWSSIRTCT